MQIRVRDMKHNREKLNNLIDFNDYLKEKLKDPKFRKEYNSIGVPKDHLMLEDFNDFYWKKKNHKLSFCKALIKFLGGWKSIHFKDK
jgi:hypothetical protein